MPLIARRPLRVGVGEDRRNLSGSGAPLPIVRGVRIPDASNYYRSAASGAGPGGSATMTFFAFVRTLNATPGAVQTIASRLSGAGYSITVVNSTGHARAQVVDGGAVTRSATNAALPARVNKDSVIHGLLSGGNLICYVNGVPGTAQAVTGYTAPLAGSVRLGIGVSPGATQPADTVNVWGFGICDATALSGAEISAHVAAINAAGRILTCTGCTYLWDGRDANGLPTNWSPIVGAGFTVDKTGSPVAVSAALDV